MGGGSRVLVVSTWGNPSRWGCANYFYGKELHVTSCCTLPLVSMMYSGSDIVLIVLDSLIDLDCHVLSGSKKDDCSCGACYSKCLEHGIAECKVKCNDAGEPFGGLRISSDGGGLEYSDIIGCVENLVKCIVECIYERDTKGLPPSNIKIIVAPGVGSPGGTWNFEGHVGDFMAKVLLEAGRLIYERLEGGVRYSKVVLDLTHGINFMPSGALYLARMIASLIVIGQLNGVVIEVYNSDPYPPRISGMEGVVPQLNLNMVYREIVKSVYVPGTMSGKLLRNANIPSGIEQILEHARYVVSSLYYPLPLALTYACRDFQVEEALNKLSEAMKEWAKKVEVKDFKVKRTVSIDVDAIYPILLASFTCKSVSEIVKRLKGDIADDKVSVKVLRGLGKKVYNMVSDLHEHIITYEVRRYEKWKSDIINELLANYKASGETCKRLAELIPKLKAKHQKGREPDRENGSQNPDRRKRVMIAHAGLQYDYVDVCIDSKDDIAVRYSKDYNYKKLLRESALLIEMQSL